MGHLTINWERVLPVLVSIGLIVSVAILRSHSRYFAAIAVTMPLNITVGLLIVAMGEKEQNAVLRDFSTAIVINIIPTLFFIAVMWFVARSGGNLVKVLGMGYAGWALAMGIVLTFRGLLLG